jgi:hypothetical protein
MGVDQEIHRQGRSCQSRKRNRSEARGRKSTTHLPTQSCSLGTFIHRSTRVRIQRVLYIDRHLGTLYIIQALHYHSVPDCQPPRKVRCAEGAIGY